MPSKKSSNDTALERSLRRTKGEYPPNEGVASFLESRNQTRLLQSKAPPKDYSGRTPEGKVKGQVRKLLDEYKLYYFMPATGGYGKSGVWDFCLSVEGVHVQIEAKATPDHPLSQLQWDNGVELIASGGVGIVVNDPANTYEVVRDILGNIDRVQRDVQKVLDMESILGVQDTWSASVLSTFPWGANIFLPGNPHIKKEGD